MFRELKDVDRQGEKKRRWFEDSYFDLCVWYDPDGSIYGFQLCYDRNYNEHSFTWDREKGSHHNRIDSGDEFPGPKRTPILIPDGILPYEHLVKAFRDSSQGLDGDIVAIVLEKLAVFPRSKDIAV